MAFTRNNRTGPTPQEIALEIVKAALAGGAIYSGKTDEASDLLKLASKKAVVDAVYAVRFYQTVLTRLENPPVAQKATA